MLVLGRKQNESVVIEGRIKVTVLGIKSGRIRLGIEAPQDVHVRRSELLESERNSVVVDA
jgi:carbon storage regulator